MPGVCKYGYVPLSLPGNIVIRTQATKGANSFNACVRLYMNAHLHEDVQTRGRIRGGGGYPVVYDLVGPQSRISLITHYFDKC